MHESVGHFNRASDAADAPPPGASVWVLQSYRAGENTQLLGLAESLGLPFTRIVVRYRRHAALAGLLRVATRSGIDRASRRRLAAPWPDLLISAGLRNEPLAAWVRRASGGRTRVVFLGRTWQSPGAFDLLVTTPQYRVPEGPCVLTNLLTQHRVTPERLAAAAREHAARLDALPRPLIGVLLGGSSGPYELGDAAADELATALRERVRVHGGSVLVSSSARTPHAFLDRLERALDGCGEVYRWRADDPANPYYAMLAGADALVVTGDSVAMLSEAAAAGKPVLIYDIPVDGKGDVTWRARLYRLMMRALPRRLTRDVALFHRRFVAAGHGAWLEPARPTEPWPAVKQRPPGPADPVPATRARVFALLRDARGTAAAPGAPAARAQGAADDPAPLPTGAAATGAARPTRPRSIR